jgi:hypothetical protein
MRLLPVMHHNDADATKLYTPSPSMGEDLGGGEDCVAFPLPASSPARGEEKYDYSLAFSPYGAREYTVSLHDRDQLKITVVNYSPHAMA